MTLNTPARLTLVLLVALPVAASAEVADLPPLPQRNPFRAPAETKVLPKDQPTIPWTKVEIGAATAKCKELLAGDPLDYEILPPIKEGLCGTPAPVLLRAVGQDPKVAIEPPATLSCPMADVLGEWLRNTVQPEAMKLFGSHVVKIQNASSYVCRNRYGGSNTPLSEHALANALDVSEFVFTSGEHLTVLESWPRTASTPLPPQPKPNRVAVATPPMKPVSQLRRADRQSFAVAKIQLAEAKINPFVARATVIDAKTNPFVVPTADTEDAPVAPPPEATPSENAAPETQSKAEGRSEFMRMVHDDACHTFGTVLGPEANEAHRNHFHLDMKARRHAAVCQ
jgi:hypothetical protein